MQIAAVDPNSAATSILLVEIDAPAHRGHLEFLKRAAYDVDESFDGRVALAKALARPFDVVVTESRIPGMNGFDLCVELRRDAAARSTAVIIECEDNGVDAERARRAGADAVLVGPAVGETIHQEVERLVARSRELHDRVLEVREKVETQLNRAAEFMERVQSRRAWRETVASGRVGDGVQLSPAPDLRCPECDKPLAYQRTHLGGVSARQPEQWDYYECSSSCGIFQYRHRTRKLRKIVGAPPAVSSRQS
jgi:DNA-binding response OmpR family regulator